MVGVVIDRGEANARVWWLIKRSASPVTRLRPRH